MHNVVETFTGILFAIFVFLDPILSAAFGALALYVYQLKNEKASLCLLDMMMLIILGLFVGYLTNEAYTIAEPVMGVLFVNGDISEVTITIFANSHNFLVALSGFSAPKILKLIMEKGPKGIIAWFQK